jgi:hypothetical protein
VRTLPKPQAADDHVVRLHVHKAVILRRVHLQGDPVARRCLAGDREIGVADANARLEGDRAAGAEHDDPLPRRIQCRAQAAGAGVIEVGDLEHLAAAAGRVGAETLRPGERHRFGPGQMRPGELRDGQDPLDPHSEQEDNC